MQIVIHSADGTINSIMKSDALPEYLPIDLIPEGCSVLYFDDSVSIGLTTHVIVEGEPVLAPLDLTDARSKKWEAVKAHRDLVVDGGCATPHGPLQSDSESRLKISGAVQMAILAQMTETPFTIVWTMADNSLVTLDAAQTIEMGLLVANHVGAAFAVGIALRSAINAVETLEELEAINILYAGWPPMT